MSSEEYAYMPDGVRIPITRTPSGDLAVRPRDATRVGDVIKMFPPRAIEIGTGRFYVRSIDPSENGEACTLHLVRVVSPTVAR